MDNKKIDIYKKRVQEAFDKNEPAKTMDKLIKIAEELSICIPDRSMSTSQRIKQLYYFIHYHLQTEIMYNTVKTAKWSCIFAALAAFLALISLCLSIFAYVFKAAFMFLFSL